MTAYALTKVCWLADRDPTFRLALKADPERALDAFTPTLPDDERAALLAGDVAELVAMGMNRFLMGRLWHLGLFGLDRATYVSRLRAAYEADPQGRTDICPVVPPPSA